MYWPGFGSPLGSEKCVFDRPSFLAVAFIFATNAVNPGPYATASVYAASQPDGSIIAYSSCRAVSFSPGTSPAVDASYFLS